MKTKLRIIVLLTFLLLITSCQRKKFKNGNKKDISRLLENNKSESLDDKLKEKYLDSLCKELPSFKNDSVKRNFYFKIALQYYDLNLLDKSLNVTRTVYKLSVKENDSSHIAKSLYYLGDYYDDVTQLDSAFYYYNKSQKLYKNIKDTLNLGRTTLYKAGILFDAGNFTESEIETVNALRLLNKTNNSRLIYESYNLLALSLKELSNYIKSLEYFVLALKQLHKLESEGYSQERVLKSRASINNNMGRVYEKMGNYPKAIDLYKKALKTKDLKQNQPKLYAMLLNNLAYSQMKSGNNRGIKEMLFTSLRIQDSLDITPGILASKISIAEYYLYKKDTLTALKYIKEGYALSKDLKSNYDILNSLKLLTENDTKNKKIYANLYFKVNDSLQEAERMTRNKFARIAFETDLIEEKNERLSKRNTYIIIASIVIFILLIALFSIYRLRSKNKELLFTQEQQKANEKIYQLMLKQQAETEEVRKEERDRIAMELHDGIVNSIFTTRFNLMQLKPDQEDQKALLVKELENTENEIRKVSHDLTQNLLFKDNNLPEIITNLVESQKNKFKTKFDITIDKYIDWSAIPSASQIHIYRIIQETLQNINKYSKAKKCFIILLKNGNKITIRIWDNGIGFNTEKIKQGIGLKNIKERTKVLNGELKINSKNGEGTTIEIII
ncbi:ATP-binding protein [Flavobacterium sp. W1B]|uniref:tetratricopeptide repeat-containing sensor histidine kinase n=1 Tax=Flavobacterium sp. W1B TaxID=3394146 RepID=UPI0039BD8C85